MKIESYTSIEQFQRVQRQVLAGDIIIQEKVDGSQFSFTKQGGKLHFRSKGNQISTSEGDNEPGGNFGPTMAALKALEYKIPEDYVFRGEALRKPKHNKLSYERVPLNHVAIFDIEYSGGFLSEPEMQKLCGTIGLEPVPTLFAGKYTDIPQPLEKYITHTSYLGGAAEGIVVKNYQDFSIPNLLIGKLVSEVFRETANRTIKVIDDVVTTLVTHYKTTARWDKAIQHCGDAGILIGGMKDLQHIVPEVLNDVQRECEGEIRDYLWNHYWPQLRKQLTFGIPSYYETRLKEDAQEAAPKEAA